MWEGLAQGQRHAVSCWASLEAVTISPGAAELSRRAVNELCK